MLFDRRVTVTASFPKIILSSLTPLPSHHLLSLSESCEGEYVAKVWILASGCLLVALIRDFLPAYVKRSGETESEEIELFVFIRKRAASGREFSEIL